MPAQNAPRPGRHPQSMPGSLAWSLPAWLPAVAWLVVAAVFAVQIAQSPHAMLAGSWCGDGALLAAASILGHCPACYGLAAALAMAAASLVMLTPQTGPDRAG